MSDIISKNNIKKILLLISISIILISFFKISYSYNNSNNKVYLKVSEILLNLTESTSITIDNIIPTLDKFGILNDSFSFNITNDDKNEKNYILKLVDDKVLSTIKNNNIRYQLLKDDIVLKTNNLNSSGLIDAGIISGNTTIRYKIKLWVDYNSSVSTGTFSKKIFVEAGDVNIDSSGANPPVILENMIPVYYDETDEVWKKANIKNNDINYMWYDYNNLIWANAVTVDKNKLDYYVNVPLGTSINIDDINTMWVWIPRYKYTLFDSDKTDLINITFERGIQNTGTITCKTSFSENGTEICTDDINKELKNGISTYTHPAFTFMDEELMGLWVAKFEASTDINSNCYKNNSATNCNNANNVIYIKPNVNSINYISMANLSYNFRKMELKDNIYSFKSEGVKINTDLSIENDINDFDIHMIKNTEWGMVNYLAKSKYGGYSMSNLKNNIIDSISSTGCINNNSDNKNNTCLYPYDTSVAVLSSTTGNIYGIYDMASNKSEYIMTNHQNNEGDFLPSSYTGFTSSLSSKYYDTYINKSNNLNIYKLGDAVLETKGFILNNNLLTNYNSFIRGMNGLFSYGYNNTLTSSKTTSRPVLKVEQKLYITRW